MNSIWYVRHTKQLWQSLQTDLWTLIRGSIVQNLCWPFWNIIWRCSTYFTASTNWPTLQWYT